MLPQSLINAQNSIFDQMYIGNTLNRLRQLNQPTISDCKRWFWELLQNADDVKASEISINVSDRIVEFTHNGIPFNANTLFGLLYKFSSKSQNDISSTGRFGTGFLTTHTISKIVDIESDYDDSGTILGFNVTIHREGFEKEELLNGLRLMRDSLKFKNQSYNHTKFTYNVNTQQGRNAVELGIKNILDNIVQTLLFLKHITKINFNFYGELQTYEKIDPNTIKINECYQEQIKTFYIISSVESSEILTKRFGVDRNLQLQIAIEYKEDTPKHSSLVVQNDFACSYYCVLPLVGSENLKLPFIINSPDFQPDSERESLYLNGTNENETTGRPSDSGINKYILMESVKLFEQLIDVINDKNCDNRQILLRGISKIPNFDKYFDKQFYEKYCSNLINVIDKTPIVMCSDGIKRTTKEVIFCDKITYPIYKKLGLNVPDEYQSNLWNKYVKYNTPKNLIEYVIKNNIKNVEILNMIYTNEAFIPYIKKDKIVLNYNHEFINYEDSFDVRHVDEHILNIWFKLDENAKNKCISKSINIPILNRHAMRNNRTISIEINDLISKLTFKDILKKCDDFIYIVPNNNKYYDPDFINNRKMLSHWINELFNRFPHEIIINNNIDEIGFKSLDEKLLKGIIDFICEKDSLDETGIRIQDYGELLEFVELNHKKDYEDLKCYPDLDLKFHKLTELYDCRNVPKLFYDKKYHLRSKLLDKHIKCYNRIMSISELENILDNDASIAVSDLLTIKTNNPIQQKMFEIYTNDTTLGQTDKSKLCELNCDIKFDKHNKLYLSWFKYVDESILDVMDYYDINYSNKYIKDIFNYDRLVNNIYYYEGPVELYYLYNTNPKCGVSRMDIAFIVDTKKYNKHKLFKTLTEDDLKKKLEEFMELDCDPEMKLRLLKWLNENKTKYKDSIKTVYDEIPYILLSLVNDDNIDMITDLLYSKLVDY